MADEPPVPKKQKTLGAWFNKSTAASSSASATPPVITPPSSSSAAARQPPASATPTPSVSVSAPQPPSSSSSSSSTTGQPPASATPSVSVPRPSSPSSSSAAAAAASSVWPRVGTRVGLQLGPSSFDAARGDDVDPQRASYRISPTDIGLFVGSRPDDNLRRRAIEEPWVPPADYAFPVQIRFSKLNNKEYSVRFQRRWFDRYPWMGYSHAKLGCFCRYCVLFSLGIGGGNRLSVLVTKSLTNWKDFIEVCDNHSSKKYHKDCTLRAEGFQQHFLTGDVVEQMDKSRQKQAQVNRKVLASIIETVKPCGRQNIALRGKKDYGDLTDPTNPETAENEGNFRSMLRFRMASGDTQLLSHCQSSPRSAQYVSKRIQNEIISICETQIRSCLVKKISEAKFFSILADETADISRTEQFSLCLRYVPKEDGNFSIREDFLGFVPLVDLRGETLATVILESLNGWGLSLELLRGQGYDVASNMSGRFQGVQARILEKYPTALYTHCSSHTLNLALCSASNNKEIRKFMCNLSEVISFLRESPKRHRLFLDAIDACAPDSQKRQLKSICETRWVERHEALMTCVQLLSPVVATLRQLSDDDDQKTAAKADLFVHRVCSIEFLRILKSVEAVLATTIGLSRQPQSKSLDLVECVKMIGIVKSELHEMRTRSDDMFDIIFNKVEEMCNSFGIAVLLSPLVVRNNPDVTPRSYFRVAIFIRFLDSVIRQLDDRFDNLFVRMSKTWTLIPAHMHHAKYDDMEDLIELYAADLDSKEVVLAQISL